MRRGFFIHEFKKVKIRITIKFRPNEILLTHPPINIVRFGRILVAHHRNRYVKLVFIFQISWISCDDSGEVRGF